MMNIHKPTLIEIKTLFKKSYLSMYRHPVTRDTQTTTKPLYERFRGIIARIHNVTSHKNSQSNARAQKNIYPVGPMHIVLTREERDFVALLKSSLLCPWCGKEHTHA